MLWFWEKVPNVIIIQILLFFSLKSALQWMDLKNIMLSQGSQSPGDHVLHDSIYMKYPESIETENRAVVA